jgi:CDP-glycerol glycerophosphotransferase (TagB/SpsB family)
VLARYPEIAVSDPLWRSDGPGDWASIVPTREDVALLANVVAHSDVVINVGSTMAMDFAAFDKPAIFIAYDPPERDGHWSFENIYRLPHFKTTHELQPVHWARGRDELAAVVMHALEHPAEKSEARRRWLHLHVEQPMDQASRRLSEALRALAAGDRRAGAA